MVIVATDMDKAATGESFDMSSKISCKISVASCWLLKLKFLLPTKRTATCRAFKIFEGSTADDEMDISGMTELKADSDFLP